MKRPDMSWRPTTGQLTTTALAIVCLLLGFWIGWQHRSSADPQTVTPSVPAGMRTRNVIILPTPTTAPTTTATTGTATSTTATAPVAALPPRAQVKVAVLNAGSTSGVAVQIAVRIVQLGYPTPVTGNVRLPPSLVPTQSPTVAPHDELGHTIRDRAAHRDRGDNTRRHGAGEPDDLERDDPDHAHRAADCLLPARRRGHRRAAGDRPRHHDIAPIPASAALQAAAPTAQLVVVVGNP